MAVESVCKIAEWAGPLTCPFLERAAEVNLGVVVFGGLAGGLLQPVYARLNPKQPNPSTGRFWWNPLLGLAAAGISVYVVANSKPDDAVRLLFFAVLCGLAFPSVLASAVDRLTQNTEDVQRDVAQIAQQAESNDVDVTAQAADDLRTTLANNPVDAIGARGVRVVEAGAQLAVQNIAQTAKTDPSTAGEVINQLQQVAAVAKTAGYSGTVKAAATQLAKLGTTAHIEDALKSIANGAAKQLTG